MPLTSSSCPLPIVCSHLRRLNLDSRVTSCARLTLHTVCAAIGPCPFSLALLLLRYRLLARYDPDLHMRCALWLSVPLRSTSSPFGHIRRQRLLGSLSRSYRTTWRQSGLSRRSRVVPRKHSRPQQPIFTAAAVLFCTMTKRAGGA